MVEPKDNDEVQGGLSEEEKRENVIRLAFDGQAERFDEFCRILQ